MTPRNGLPALLALLAACTGGPSFEGTARFDGAARGDLSALHGVAPTKSLLAELPRATASRLRRQVALDRFLPGEAVIRIGFRSDIDLWDRAGRHGWDFRVLVLPCAQTPGSFVEYIALPEVLVAGTALGTAKERPQGLPPTGPFRYEIVVLARNPVETAEHPAYDLIAEPVDLCPVIHGGMRNADFRIGGLRVPGPAL